MFIPGTPVYLNQSPIVSQPTQYTGYTHEHLNVARTRNTPTFICLSFNKYDTAKKSDG
jgi:hypothetical protein